MLEERKAAEDLLDKVVKESRKHVSNAKRELNAFKANYLELLDAHTKSDGTLNKSRISSMQDELDSYAVEYGNIVEENTENSVNAALAIVLLLLIPSGRLARDYRLGFDDVYNTRLIDGKTLRDRVLINRGTLQDKLRTHIRTGAYSNTPIHEIYANISKQIDDDFWKEQSIIVSETNNIYRKQVGEIAKSLGDEYVQFYESQLCTSRNHKNHRCHILAHEDRYGLGEGVFKVTDTEIYYPHTNCRGFIGFYNGGDA